MDIQSDLRSDLTAELTGKNTEFQREVQCLKIKMIFSKAERKNQNHRAELDIWEIRRKLKRKMIQKQVPHRIWDYGLIQEAEVLSIIAQVPTGRT
eukprot:3206297-Ditylum_brightwellii.AAC.1